MKGDYFLLCTVTVILIVYSTAEKAQFHKVVKRQSSAQRSFPLSRSRQYPPPEELEESDEYATSEDEEEPSIRREISGFRGRQPPLSDEEEYVDDYSYTEAPKVTTPTPAKPTSRTVVFNNRFAGRPRFGSQTSVATPSPVTSSVAPLTTSAPRFRGTPAQSQRLDVVANVLNKPASPRPASRSIASSSSLNQNRNSNVESPNKTNTTTGRVRTRGRFRPKTSTTTTTTTTTTAAPQPEEYYYYYEDEEPKEELIATTTTTTTTKRPTLPRRTNVGRRPASARTPATARPVKFDPESQFQPPPDDVPPLALASSSTTKKFTTTTTEAPGPGNIPAHLKNKYRPRTDNRFIDFLRDPNRPRELKGFDLTDYPFYIRVPEDIDFDCNDMKDGYYASIPHRCQLFHYCFAGARYDFLCANYTLYDQTTFTCRFANNVDCPSSEKFYYRNDDLWKETPTTIAPEPKKKRITPKDDDYEDDYEYDDDYEDEEEVERRRRPAKRRRNRRKNRRRPAE